MRSLLLASVLLALPACSLVRPANSVVPVQTSDWREVATPHDRERLRGWRDAFVEALQDARAAGYGADIDREGALLAPDAALAGATIPNGEYRCRVIKLGGQSAGLLDYVAYPYFACRVRQERNLQSFAKLTGSQRQVGFILRHDAIRQVFLGTLVLGDEARAMQYGRDRQRDVAGFVERIGPARWRLIMPRPAFESTMDVLELVPAS